MLLIVKLHIMRAHAPVFQLVFRFWQFCRISLETYLAIVWFGETNSLFQEIFLSYKCPWTISVTTLCQNVKLSKFIILLQARATPAVCHFMPPCSMSGVKQLIATSNGLTYLTNLHISHKRGTIVLLWPSRQGPPCLWEWRSSLSTWQEEVGSKLIRKYRYWIRLLNLPKWCGYPLS